MRKHKLIELQKIIEERIGSLTEEVEIATNVKLNPLYIADRKDEIEFLRWTVTIINSILNRDIDRKQVQIGTTKMRLELLIPSSSKIHSKNNNRLRKQLIKIQDTEDEISAQIQN